MLKFLKHSVRRFRLQRVNIHEPISLAVEKPGGPKGWPVCPDFIHADSVVYGFGVGANVIWDLGMIERFGTTVHAFDPTPESIAWVAKQSFPEKFVFHDYGISSFDGHLEFFAPKKPGRMHYSQDRRQFTRPDEVPFRGPVYRLKTITEMLGHDHVDVLKLDVEGSEFDCVPELLDSGISIGQILVEVHYTFPSRSFDEGVTLLKRIQAAGFQCHYVSERGLEFSFLNRRLLTRRAAA